MNLNRVILITLGLALLLGWLFFGGRGSRFRHDWRTLLRSDKKSPYDLSVFYSTVKAEYGSRYNEIPANSGFLRIRDEISPENGDLYLFAGKKAYLTVAEAQKLVGFVSRGGKVFMAVEALPESLPELLQQPDLYIKSDYSESYFTEFTNRNLNPRRYFFSHRFGTDFASTEWNQIDFRSSFYDDMASESDNNAKLARIVLSKGDADSARVEKGADFMMIKYGQGCFYLHSNPVLLSNYHLNSDRGPAYLANIFSHLPDANVWVDFSAAIPKLDAEFGGKDRNMLDFIRSQKGLWIAWILLLSGVGAFLAFGGRRIQRSIPVIEPPVNHTMAFIDAVGRFYKTQKQNALVFRREWNQLNIYVRQNFRLTISTDEAGIRRLAERSGVSENTIRQLLTKYEKYRIFSELRPEELKDMNQVINQFYLEHRSQYGKSNKRKQSAQSA